MAGAVEVVSTLPDTILFVGLGEELDFKVETGSRTPISVTTADLVLKDLLADTSTEWATEFQDFEDNVLTASRSPYTDLDAGLVL